MESNRIEYKRELTDGLEKEAVAFLNYKEGGVLYIGIDRDGSVAGISSPDDVQLGIKDKLKYNILPSCLGLFDVILEKRDSKDIIKITFASGPEKPYYIKKHGMSEKGCYIRIGSASEPMSVRMIEDLFTRRTRNSLGRIRSPRQDLSFEQLRIYYQEACFELGDKFVANLELLTEEKEFNYAAYLLADHNGNSVQVAKYCGLDRVNLIDSNEYGYCSLIKTCKQVLDRLDVENRTATRITPKERINRRLWNAVALRETVINAIIHNDYTNEATPKFEIFDDRLEITSAGSIPQGIECEEFFAGYSIPRNKILMRIFKDLDIVEYLGSGMPRILRAYPKESFSFSVNFIRTVFPIDPKALKLETPVETPVKTPVKTPDQIIQLLKKNPAMTLADVAAVIGKSRSAVERAGIKLVKAGFLRFVGPKKGGYWEFDTTLTRAAENVLIEMSEKTPLNIGGNIGGNMAVKILAAMKENSDITITELAILAEVSARSIERMIKNLQNKGILRRIGPTNGGHWEII